MAALQSVFAVITSLVLLVFSTALSEGSSSCKKSPIVIVPGYMGTQLEARLVHKHSNHWYCFKTYNEWYRLWLNMDDLASFSQNCFRENIRLYYNQTLGHYSNRHGVEIRVPPPQFGGTESFEYVDPHLSDAAYFDKFVSYFEGLGYKKSYDIVGAAYDWRYGPVELERTGYFTNLKQLIENTRHQFNNCPVTLVAHSMGGLVSHHFLVKSVTQQWKDTYIHQYITLGAVWGGASKPLKAVISGDDDHIFTLTKPLVLREDERSFAGLYWLLPSPNIWNKDQIIVTTPTSNYTAHNVAELLQELSYDNGLDLFNRVADSSLQGLPPPNVTVYCLYGILSSNTTELSYRYEKGDFPDHQPSVFKGEGDGTVNRHSLEACQVWAKQQSHKFYHASYQTDHVGIVRDDSVLEFIKKLVFGI